MKFLDIIKKYMYGRYGIDELNKFLLILYIALSILSLFIKTNILSIIKLFIIIITFFRCFSRKIYKRSKENQIYLKLKKKVLKPIRNIKRNYKERNEWIYKRCKYCKKLLKLPIPNKRGIKEIKCPKCKKNSKIFTIRQTKIDYIKK